MIICNQHKFIFIHIPKNSGTEMSKTLQNKYKNYNYIQFFNKKSIKKINNLYKKDFELLNYKLLPNCYAHIQ
jgi:hypothetical protein